MGTRFSEFVSSPSRFLGTTLLSLAQTTSACGRNEAAELGRSSSSAVGESPEVTWARLCHSESPESWAVAGPVWLLRRRWLRSWTGGAKEREAYPQGQTALSACVFGACPLLPQTHADCGL